MPAKNQDLHGNVPDDAPVALVIVDVINDLQFPGGERLLRHALPMADRLAALKRRAKAAGIPVIYANDNFGRWKSDFRRILERCLQAGMRGRPLAERLAPDEDDYFVLKPKHSAFFATTLDVLLRYLSVHTVILTGLTGDSCVLFTAADAFMRDFHLVVPADCVASIDPGANRRALEHMRKTLHADVRPSRSIAVERLAAGVVPAASRTSRRPQSHARVRRRRGRAGAARGR
jgi:nicotinamidase-related amidase